MPTLEVLAEVLEESQRGITVGTVDCTTQQNLCTKRFPVRVRGGTVVHVDHSMYTQIGVIPFIYSRRGRPDHSTVLYVHIEVV